jgi:hypothetical protein
MDAAADAQLYLAPGEFLPDVACIRKGAGEPVKLGNDEGVSFPACRQSFPQSGAGPVGAGVSVIDEDLLVLDAKGAESIDLRGEFLFGG